MQALEPDETHLVLSAPTNKRTMFDVIERFGVLKPNRIILSKTRRGGCIGQYAECCPSHGTSDLIHHYRTSGARRYHVGRTRKTCPNDLSGPDGP